MKKTSYFIAIGFISAILAPLFAQTVNVSGKWDLTMETGQNPVSRIYTFEQTGEKLIVKWTKKGEEQQAEGTIKGNKIEWTDTAKVNDEEIKVAWTGKVEGDTMSGETDFGGQATFTWKAARKK